MHPATRSLLRFFEYEHLPSYLQEVSRPFFSLACELVARDLDGPELTAGLRKLLESKDCVVRAAIVAATPGWSTAASTPSAAPEVGGRVDHGAGRGDAVPGGAHREKNEPAEKR